MASVCIQFSLTKRRLYFAHFPSYRKYGCITFSIFDREKHLKSDSPLPIEDQIFGQGKGKQKKTPPHFYYKDAEQKITKSHTPNIPSEVENHTSFCEMPL